MRVRVIGDSISVHYRVFLGRYLRGGLQLVAADGVDEASRDPDDPRGANGGDSTRVVEVLERGAAAGGIDADLLLVNCGLHDIRTDPRTGIRQVSPGLYERNLRRIVEIVSGTRPTLAWIRTTPCDEAVHNGPGMEFHRFAADCDEYNRIADRIMAEAGVPSIDLHGFTRDLGPDVFCDHVHFREEIRGKQAAYIAGWLEGFLRGSYPTALPGGETGSCCRRDC